MDRGTLVQSLHNANLDLAAGLLKSIKNDLIGHEARKAEYVRCGLLPSLAKILQTAQSRTKQDPLVVERAWIESAYLVAILAHQGPAYVQPIFESKVLPTLVERIASASTPRESFTILRCLKAIADNLPPKEPTVWTQDCRLTDLLFSSDSIDAVIAFIPTSRKSLSSQQLSDQAIALLCKTCITEQHKRFLVDRGLLRVLARRLASFIVSDGLVIPSLEALDFPSTASSGLPEALPRYAHLSPALECIALLIEHSKVRAEALLSDPSIALVLPQPRHDFSPTDFRQAPWASSHLANLFPQSRTRNPFDGLLPNVPTKEKSNSPSSLNFPPLGAGLPGSRRRTSFHPLPSLAANMNLVQDSQTEMEETTLIPYLIYIARQSRGRRRLLACRLLAAFLTLGLIPRSRAKSFSTLIVPIVVAMLDQQSPEPTTSSVNIRFHLCTGLHYSKAAPAVLASLVMDDADLQKVAVESKAINKLANGLRQTFETPSGRKVSPWRPQKVEMGTARQSSLACIVGSGGPSHAMRQDMAHREGTLQALAAIAPFNDAYRKEICDQGILQQIMLSLEPFHPDQAVSNEQQPEMRGNSASTILAACGAVRALTRSVTALRTKLVDADVVKAIIKLMNIPDPEVRIAATKVLINLAMDFSPMKESVSDAAVVKKLCEQAHSANARLRLESIWALKQLVVNASKKLKQEVVNELGSSWIKLLIKTDPYDIPAGEVIGLVDKEYPPRTSDEISGVTTISEDVVMSEDSDGEQSVHFADASSELEPDAEFCKHTPEDDLAIQVQLLDLIRNLFCGDNASDLVDYVLGEFDRDEFFKIMLTRIRPRTQMGATRKDNQITPAPKNIIIKALYILVHIAACSQKWRDFISRDHAILKQVMSFHNHPEAEVRAQCCWLGINLLFEDETSDRTSCRKRALELQRIGYASNVRKLENDPDSDVRERAKTAVHLLTSLLEGRWRRRKVPWGMMTCVSISCTHWAF